MQDYKGWCVIMIDMEEAYNSTIKKTQSLLENKGIALSLREIKDMSIINLSGFRNDGERLLRLELAEKYGESVLEQSQGYQILYPFIDEGVIKTTTRRNEVFYTHFYVSEKRKNDFDLNIFEYDLYNGKFYLRYAMVAEGVPIKREGDGIRCDQIRYGCMKNFIFDVFSEEELHQYYSPMEYLIVKNFAEKEEQHGSNQTDVIFNQVISTFSSINFLLEHDQKSMDSIKKAYHVKVENDFTDGEKTKRKVIPLEGNIKIEVVPSDGNERIENEKIIKRHTNVWMVSGHLRHYKSGKVIFISSYPKGPERDKKDPGKMEYDLPQEEDDL